MPRDADRAAWTGGWLPRTWALGLALAAATALPQAALGTGEADTPPPLSGTYRNVATDDGQSTIEAAVERGIQDLFALAKPTARSRILSSNPPIDRVVIEVGADRVHLDMGHGRDAALPLGAWRPGRSADGTRVQLRYSLPSQGTLKVESRADGGSARHLFSLSDDGIVLRQAVRIDSTHLPDDIHYTLTYRRVR